jgi:UMF1 family MFS transporter
LKNDKRTIFGWAMYDWANSAYITTAGAIIAAFFTGEIVADSGWHGLSGQTLWARVDSAGALLLFLMMPVLGAVADFNAAKRRYLRAFAFFGAVATIVLAFVPTNAVVAFLSVFLLTQVGFVGANVFYDGFLPDIATDDTIDRISSKGYAFGYIGGGLYGAMAAVAISFSDTDPTVVRIAIAGSGVWWIGWSLYALRVLPEIGDAQEMPAELSGVTPLVAYARIGFGRTMATARKLLGFKQLLLFVIAYMIYNDGTQTVINVSGAYAEETLKLDTFEIIVAFLIVQFIAFGGALWFGALANRIGTKRAILASLVVWTGIAIGGYYLPEGKAMPLYLLAVVIGFVLGGVQALSRSLYGSMIPEEASAEFYGFYTVFSKFSAIWGPLLFGVVSAATDSGRPAIISIIVFFLLGGVLLSRVDVAAARASRDRWSFEGSRAEIE